MRRFIVFLIFLLGVLLSCKENDSINSIEMSNEFQLEKDKWKIVIDSTIIKKAKKSKLFKDSTVVIRGLECGIKYIYGWAASKYEIADGKLLGICPLTFSQSSYESYKNFYGFNQIMVGGPQHLAWAISVGYSRNNIMGAVNFNPNYVDQYGYLKYYHLDEPIENGGTPEAVRLLAEYIHVNFPSSLLMLSSFKDPDTYNYYWGFTYGDLYLNILNNASNTRIICDQYYDGTVFYGPDQVPFGEEYQEFYGQTKIFTHWISARIDYGEQLQYDYLIDAAENLGINSLWLYAGDSPSSSYIDRFCDAAHDNFWMDKYEKKYCLEYRCYFQDPCDCDPSLPDGWYLYQVWDLGQERLATR